MIRTRTAALLLVTVASLPGITAAVGADASLLSGLYPAWKAANERPVEALRS